MLDSIDAIAMVFAAHRAMAGAGAGVACLVDPSDRRRWRGGG